MIQHEKGQYTMIYYNLKKMIEYKKEINKNLKRDHLI